ncbi:tRNA/rRNA methyltransferase SpoU [Nitzschia inconspicua]|uniref:tRNA/rRNA methyltransferase SpoU n=1 Tax=Nitzschia inconspicua TaxID=303405 RepID=A0A9K3KL30_9STRA|nr:tRNA/rRNA methyltransferase SpoU [Nitzschia inconspicua]
MANKNKNKNKTTTTTIRSTNWAVWAFTAVILAQQLSPTHSFTTTRTRTRITTTTSPPPTTTTTTTTLQMKRMQNKQTILFNRLWRSSSSSSTSLLSSFSTTLVSRQRNSPRFTTTTVTTSTLQSRKKVTTTRLRLADSNNHSPFSLSLSSFSSSTSPYNIITSTKSQTVKRIQALLTKRKKRSEWGQTVVEGPRIIFDLLDNPKTSSLVRRIVVSLPEYYNNNTNNNSYDYPKRLQEALERSNNNNNNNDNNNNNGSLLVQLVTPEVFPSCSDTMTPQGIVAIVDIPNFNIDMNNNKSNDYHNNDVHADSYDPISSSSTSSSSSSQRSSSLPSQLHLVLDGVSDPGNVGTLLRSSLAVGVTSVLLLPGCCDVWNPKAVRSAMGASFQLPLIRHCDSWKDGRTFLQHEHHVTHIYAATMIETTENDNNKNDDDDDGDDGKKEEEEEEEEEDTVVRQEKQHPTTTTTTSTTTSSSRASVPYYNVDWTVGCCALVIGSEGNGLSADVRDALKSSGNHGPSNGPTTTNPTTTTSTATAIDNNNDNPVTITATHIPMQEGIESLNAAVCGSVMLFEYARQASIKNASTFAAASVKSSSSTSPSSTSSTSAATS